MRGSRRPRDDPGRNTGNSGMPYLRNQYTFYGYGLWLAEEKEQAGGLLGLAGFSDAEELSYWIVPEKRRRGYAREICSFLLEYAGGEPGLEKGLRADTGR